MQQINRPMAGESASRALTDDTERWPPVYTLALVVVSSAVLWVGIGLGVRWLIG